MNENLGGLVPEKVSVDLEAIALELRQSETVPVALNPALQYLNALAASGRRSARSQLKKLAASFGYTGEDWITAMPWHSLRSRHLKAILAAMSQNGYEHPKKGRQDYSPDTINLVLAVLRGVAREAFDNQLLPADEWERLRLIKGVRGSRLPAGRHLENGELVAMLDTCDDGTPLGVRDGAMVALLCGAGLRRGTMAELEIENLDLEARKLRAITKGNKQIEIPLPSGTIQAIEDWLKVRGRQPGPLFNPFKKGGEVIISRGISSQVVYHMLCKRSLVGRVKKCSPHDFRRSYITSILDKTGDLAVAQDLAGHADPKTTKKYDRRGERAKRAAVDLLHVPYGPRNLPMVQARLEDLENEE